MGLTSGIKQESVDARYPIGKFARPETISLDERVSAIGTLAELASLLRNAVDDLDGDQLATPYREGGWSIQQVVHHMADSHMNAFLRIRKALTEDWPTISLYEEAAWAKLPDAMAPIEWSLELVESLHARWVMMLQSLTSEQWQMGFVSPKSGRTTVEMATLMYAWHSRHHVAHIRQLRTKEDW